MILVDTSNINFASLEKKRLNLGTISKYDYTKAKYSWLTQSLYNSQQHYNLYSQQLDLINSLGGAYGIETN